MDIEKQNNNEVVATSCDMVDTNTYEGISLDEKKILKSLVSINSNYYLKEFEKIERGETSKNTFARWVYCIPSLYRKNYGYLLKYELSIIPAVLILLTLAAVAITFVNIFFGILFVVGFFAFSIFYTNNSIEFNKCYLQRLRKIINTNKITTENMNSPEKVKTIKKNGGVSFRNIFIIVFSFILIANVVGIIDKISNDSAVKTIKNSELSAYPGITIEKVFTGYMKDIKWESGKSEDNIEFVNVTGKILYNQKTIEATFQFVFSNDNTSFSIYTLEFNGIPQNTLMINTLIELMYEEAGYINYMSNSNSIDDVFSSSENILDQLAIDAYAENGNSANNSISFDLSNSINENNDEIEIDDNVIYYELGTFLEKVPNFLFYVDCEYSNESPTESGTIYEYDYVDVFAGALNDYYSILELLNFTSIESSLTGSKTGTLWTKGNTAVMLTYDEPLGMIVMGECVFPTVSVTVEIYNIVE